MKLSSMALFLVLTIPTVAWPCGEGKTTATDASGALGCEQERCASWQQMSVKELRDGRKIASVVILDANSPQTRSKYGVIPGATLLTSASSYDVAKELPGDKNARLVFYCANARCTASHLAAERAVDAGYTQVYVLPEGIMGWREAGQPTAVPTT